MSASFVSKVADALQRFDRLAWPARRAALSDRVRTLLQSSKLVVADVGSAAGPEERWQALGDPVHFLTFEPSPREGVPPSPSSHTNFSIGLSSRKGRGVLTLTRDADASTLYPVNQEAIEPFPIREGLAPVGKTEIDLDTLDHCLEASLHLSPDFLKVDVEGADLDVLRGASAALDTSILGVRVEVSFLERHRGAPFFGETDAFLRERGFQLFHLSREQWIRRNLVCGFTSQPQIAWGDAVYFISAERFLQRLAGRPEEQREALIAKLTVILLVHGVHDYAMDLVARAAEMKLIPAEWGRELEGVILKSVDDSPLYLARSFTGVLFALIIYLLAFPLKSARPRATFYVQQRTGHFSRILTRMAGRSGPRGSCISD